MSLAVMFHRSGHKPRERLLSEAFGEGVRAHGDDFRACEMSDYVAPRDDVDVAVMFGVKSARVMRDYLRTQSATVFMDKGYTRMKAPGSRTDLYHRVSVNGFQPLYYFQDIPRPSDRWERIGKELKPWRAGLSLRDARHVVFAGSSQKYCDWHGLGPATEYANSQCKKLRKHQRRAARAPRPIIYRPKPSWKEAVPIPGCAFSRNPETIQDVLENAWALVTYGSNAAIDAIVEGVPAIVLGDGIARPICSNGAHEILDPLTVNDQVKYQWACDMAYCQWTTGEMRSGEMWGHLRERILS